MEIYDTGDSYSTLKLFLLELAYNFNYKYTKLARETLKNKLSEISGIHQQDLVIDESNHHHYGRTCGHRFVRGETCWRCLTCGYDETCALCQHCFREEEHIGHDVHKSIIQRDFPGCCDCGDEEAYKDSKCALYTVIDDTPLFTTVDDRFIEHLNTFLGTLIDFVIDFTNHSVSSLSPPDRADQIRLRHQMCVLNQKAYYGVDNDTPKYALVLYSDQVHQYRDAVQRIRFVTGKVTEYAEMIATRCNEHGRAVVMVSENIPYLLKKQEILTLTGLTACIKNVREVFREEMCDDIIRWIYEFTQSNIAKSNYKVRCTIPKTFLSPYNSGCMNQWLDVYHEKVLLNPRCLRSVNKNFTDPNDNQIQSVNSKWDLPESIKEDCQYYDDVKESDVYSGSRLQFLLLFDARFCKATRVNLHAIYIPAIAKNSIYNGMLVAQFIDVYETILTLFLLVDREPELSAMPLLSTQLFSSPSNDSLILKHGDIGKMIRTIYNYITTGQTTTISQTNNLYLQNKSAIVLFTLKNRKWAHVLLDLTYVITRNPDIENIFTFFLCFPQYIYLLSVFQGKPVFKREAEKHIEYESQDYAVFFNAVSVISHFSENIGRILNRIPKSRLLSQGNPMDFWYHSYSKSMVKPFTETLYTMLIRKIIELTFNDRGNEENSNGAYQKVIDDKEDSVKLEPCEEFANFSMINFDVLKGKMSFLHPLHNMFSWMIEMDQSIDSEKSLLHLMDIIQGEYEYYISEKNNDATEPLQISSLCKYEGVMGIFDIPLRKIVLISQIKIGLWVRNGTSLKSQMNLYRYGGSREFGYMRDLFLCQVYVGYFRYVQLLMYTIFDRWKLLPWLSGNQKELPYSMNILHAILEEFVLFIIALVTEDIHLHKLSAEDVSVLMVQREIVHSLLYDTKCYEDITVCIPDHICSLKIFPIVFQQCVEPIKDYVEISEEKVYRLKDEYLNTIDPYYVHLSSNRRDHCIAQMKEYIAKRDVININDVVITPKVIDWTNSPFERVVDILIDEKVLSFLYVTLAHCKTQILKNLDDKKPLSKENNEPLLSLTLHLTHIAMQHKSITDVKPVELLKIFVELLSIYKSNIAPELNSKLKCVMKLISQTLEVMNYDFKTHIPDFDFAMFDNNFALMENTNKVNSDLSHEKKKKLAKKKKKKLLAKLQKQRQKFAENHMVDDLNDSGSEMKRSIDSIQGFKISSSDETSTETNNRDDENLTHDSGKKQDAGSFQRQDEHENEIIDGNEQSYDLNTNENDSSCPVWKYPEHNCLLCHMPPTDENEIFGVFSYITESNEFRYVPIEDEYWFHKAFGGNSNLDDENSIPEKLKKYAEEFEHSSIIGPGFPSTSDDLGSPGYSDNISVFTSCSHGMHVQCFKQYYESSVDKQLSQITRTSPENIQRREFICPLCKTINNVFIPVCYTSNKKKFFNNFASKLNVNDIMNPKLNSQLLKNPIYLDNIRDELLANVKSNITPKDWFIDEEVNNITGTKKYVFSKESKIPMVLKDCLMFVTSVSPPFESFGLTISRTIESLEILLRGEGYSTKNENNKLLLFQLNNRSLTSLRIWLQISEVFKCTLGIQREDETVNYNPHLYSQSLIGLYGNLFEDDNLMFNGQDFFTGLIHCEEVKSIGYPFQKLVGIFFTKHIKQSLMKVMVALMKRNEGSRKAEHYNEILKTDIFAGNRYILKNIICKFISIDDCAESLIDIIYSMTIKLVTPFIRKCLILGYAKYARFEVSKMCIGDNLRECDKICDVMNIPRVDEIIESFDVEFFANVTDIQKRQLLNSRIAYPGLIRLIHLPSNLNEFYTEYYAKLIEKGRCDDPAICLFCGDVVDLQKRRYGDLYGSCTMHLRWECMNGGRGMFFLPRNNCCLLLDNGKGSFIDSPYRDEFGELDRDYKKGHNVILSEKKYDDIIRNIWLNHNIQNIIAQKLDNLTDIGGWCTL